MIAIVLSQLGLMGPHEVLLRASNMAAQDVTQERREALTNASVYMEKSQQFLKWGFLELSDASYIPHFTHVFHAQR